MELSNFNSKEKQTSLFLVDEVNKFRKEEGNRSNLAHSDLLKKNKKGV